MTTIDELLDELEFELVQAQKNGNHELLPGIERCIEIIIESQSANLL